MRKNSIDGSQFKVIGKAIKGHEVKVYKKNKGAQYNKTKTLDTSKATRRK